MNFKNLVLVVLLLLNNKNLKGTYLEIHRPLDTNVIVDL